MKTQDMDSIRFVTQHFKDLQGLKALVPWSLILIAGGLARLVDTDYAFVFYLTIAVGALWMMAHANDYYLTRFGEAQPRTATLSARVLLTILMLCLGGLFLLRATGSPWSDDRLHLVVYGLLLVGLWLVRDHHLFQSYYLVLGVLLLGSAAPGRFSGFALPALARPGSGRLLTGAAFFLAGLLDHWQLVRVMGHGVSEPKASPMEERR